MSVRAEGSAVSVYDPRLCGGSAAPEVLTRDDGRSLGKLVETAAYAVMDSVQDVVMESTREQWPMGAVRAADPGTRVIGNRLHLWFGDEHKPVLRLEPVDLTEFANGAA